VTELAARLVPRTLPRLSTAIACACALAVVGGIYARAAVFSAEALPGTRVAGIDVAGLDHAQVVAAVQNALLPKLARPLVVQAGTTRVVVEPRRLFALDAVATADAALAASRRTEPERIAALVGVRSTDVAPVLRSTPALRRAAVAEIRRAGVVPARSAEITMNGVVPAVRPAQVGRALDVQALLNEVRAAALEGRPSIVAPFVPARPGRGAEAAREAVALARALVSGPVYTFFDRRPLRALSEHQLASLVRFEPRGQRFVVTLDAEGLTRLLRPSLRSSSRAPVDARFEIAGDRVRVVPARNGVGVDSTAAVREVTAAAYSHDRRVASIQLAPVAPETTTAELTALGITRKVSSFTTEMGPSSFNRIWNVHLMADYIDGTIVKPGATFSFNRVVGPRTVARGFREGQMIVGSLLLPSIGGGVCQTATTLFNNAFDLGLPIIERHNHSFYISHYPLGRDATVSWGGPDFVFKNDLKNALLIKTSYTDSTLTFTFYGTPAGRRVVARTGPQVNWRAPGPSYAYDPYGVPGSVRTVSGSNQPGFDVTVYRTVYDRGGDVLRKDAFLSKYIAVGPTTIYGPGTTPPGPYFVLPPPE
jgi:vancomycin resistance protein YoaR